MVNHQPPPGGPGGAPAERLDTNCQANAKLGALAWNPSLFWSWLEEKNIHWIPLDSGHGKTIGSMAVRVLPYKSHSAASFWTQLVPPMGVSGFLSGFLRACGRPLGAAAEPASPTLQSPSACALRCKMWPCGCVPGCIFSPDPHHNIVIHHPPCTSNSVSLTSDFG